CGHFIFFTFSTLIFSSLLSGQCSSIGGQLCDYHFIGKNMTWKAAKEYCRKHHTDLATVSNQTDMQRLHNHAKFQAGAWIGLQREWRWSQPGVEFNESKWSQGEPNNVGNQENCVWMRNDKWNDISCSNTPESCKLSQEHFLDRPVQRL
uniref:C-type lectin domain-containing protein n=1 Tax=Sander lucioperca TaxID=283035 RepID=A0A8C9X834_SANLU